MSDPVERMMAKLHNKLKDSGSTLPSGSGAESIGNASPTHIGPPAVQLEWLESENGQHGYYDSTRTYSISWVTIGRVMYFECWKLFPKSGWFRPLAQGCRTEDEARACAQRDSEKR